MPAILEPKDPLAAKAKRKPNKPQQANAAFAAKNQPSNYSVGSDPVASIIFVAGISILVLFF